ncbi:unnamed protein product, partial [Chrysoparadoxa australica]
MSHDRNVIRHHVSEIGFGFYSAKDIKAISCKQITSPVTFDNLNNPLPSGLYDPCLGPTDSGVVCPTCGQDLKNCPGHLGHIELAVPVYHPLLFTAAFKLLKVKCFQCHALRLGAARARRYEVKLGLVDAGEAGLAQGLDDELRPFGPEQADQLAHCSANTLDYLSACPSLHGAVLRKHEDIVKKRKGRHSCTGHDRTYRRDLVESLLRDLRGCKKCENCGCMSAGLRKDGHLCSVPLPDIFPLCAWYTLNFEQEQDDSDDDMGALSDDNDDEDEEEDANTQAVKASKTPQPGAAGDVGGGQATSKDKFMPPSEAEAQLKLLWGKMGRLLSLVYCSSYGEGAEQDGYLMFFLRTIAVPPPRFRPPMTMGSMVAEHPQNVYLTKVVLNLNERLQAIEDLEGEGLGRYLNTWTELQSTVNSFIDSSKAGGLGNPKDRQPGVRQLLEKKEGLFRKHMMGKRVNYACRSVISPDPYIGTTEIGIPVRFAKTLTFAQPVAPWNVEYLRKLVENGPNTYPGANFVEDKDGRMYDLSRFNDLKRKATAAQLLTLPRQKVWRHLRDGDAMLVNRQASFPTLHKPGIMAHHVRVLRNPSYQTIRMHYANCNTYNADFDGDEINCHLPQNELARAEANCIAFTDEQYISNTDGSPLRGLIQDSVDAGVKMCSKDCWLTREVFQQLIFQALAGLPGLEICPPGVAIETPIPALLRPRERWSGKQVFSTILRHLTRGLPQLNTSHKARTPAAALGEEQLEHKVVFRDGELIQGVLDKGAFGTA